MTHHALRAHLIHEGDTLVRLDERGRVIDVEPGEGALFLPEASVGCPFDAVLGEDEAELLRALLRAASSGEGRGVAILERIADDGAPTVWECRVTHLAARGESTIVARDVTALCGLRDQLAALQRTEAVARLARGVGHDVNNALTVIRSYATVLRRRTSDAESVADLDAIVSAAQRATCLASSLVDLGKPRGGAPSEVIALLRSLERGLRLLVGDAITFELALPQGEVLWADIAPERVEQVVLNLVLNAREAMPNGGHLRIEARGGEVGGTDEVDGPRGVEVVVEDNGSGIPLAALPHIFEPQFTTRHGRGAGLGLSNVKTTLLGAGGDIEVTSEEGRGTRVIVRLPSAGEDQAGMSRP